MNFARGKQMIVFDTGLNALSGRRMSVPLTLPRAFRRWILHPHNSIHAILNGVAQQAHAAPGGLDAVHFMGHGSPGLICLGREVLTMAHVDLFRMLQGKVRVIAFFACSIGGQRRGGSWHRGHRPTFGQAIARSTGARTVVGQDIQWYDVGPNGEVDFGAWDGPVDVYDVGVVQTFQDDNPVHGPIRRFDLEEVIFQ